MPKYRNYSEQDVLEAVKASKSLANVMRLLKLVPVGGNYRTIKRLLFKLKPDTSHFTGQGWNKGLFTKPLEQKISTDRIKAQLISIRGHKCEKCGLSEWLGQPIMIELEHKSGDWADHSVSNLSLLCPNCHSQTPTWRGRNKGKRKIA